MLLTNYHTHGHYCDGKGSPAEMLAQAIELGFKAIGFSSHAPLPFDNDFCMYPDNLSNYVDDINALKSQSDIEVYLGLECDFIEGVVSPNDTMWQALNLDYKIGSVHALSGPNDQYPMLSVDGPLEELDQLINGVYQGDVRAMVESYYQCVGTLCRSGGFDILGHYDLVKKHNLSHGLFDEQAPWYREVAINTLDSVAQSGVVLEVNYGGIIRGATQSAYPSYWLLEAVKARHIPIQINADAHAPYHLGTYHQACREQLLQLGFTEQRVLLKGRWQDVPL